MNISSVWFYSQHPAPTSLCCRAAWTHFAYTELEGPRNSYLPPGPPMLNQWLLVQGYKYSSSLASTWTTEGGLTLSPELPCGAELKCHPPPPHLLIDGLCLTSHSCVGFSPFPLCQSYFSIFLPCFFLSPLVQTNSHLTGTEHMTRCVLQPMMSSTSCWPGRQLGSPLYNQNCKRQP